jgi:hypothetical protein
VDGVERISNYAGALEASARGVYWGSLSTLDTGRGNFNSVVFQTTVPEAGGGLLVAATGLAAFGWRRLGKRRRPPV